MQNLCVLFVELLASVPRQHSAVQSPRDECRVKPQPARDAVVVAHEVPQRVVLTVPHRHNAVTGHAAHERERGVHCDVLNGLVVHVRELLHDLVLRDGDDDDVAVLEAGDDGIGVEVHGAQGCRGDLTCGTHQALARLRAEDAHHAVVGAEHEALLVRRPDANVDGVTAAEELDNLLGFNGPHRSAAVGATSDHKDTTGMPHQPQDLAAKVRERPGGDGRRLREVPQLNRAVHRGGGKQRQGRRCRGLERYGKHCVCVSRQHRACCLGHPGEVPEHNVVVLATGGNEVAHCGVDGDAVHGLRVDTAADNVSVVLVVIFVAEIVGSDGRGLVVGRRRLSVVLDDVHAFGVFEVNELLFLIGVVVVGVVAHSSGV
eukprot:PhM_4_TR16363/c0_g1_i1/m.33269